MTAQDVADLYAEIERLQCALNFWMPCVPEGETDEKFMDRVYHDANLLAGYNGQIEETAEDLGWIALRAHPTSNEEQS